MMGIMDYAGLFPPANLDMASALANYQSHLSGPQGWILDKFLLTWEQLEQCPPDRTLSLCLVINDNHPLELAHYAISKNRPDALDQVHAIETRVRPQETPATWVRALEEMAKKMNKTLPPIFLEPSAPDPSLEFIHALSTVKRVVGLKFRCGGPALEDVPPPDFMAKTIHACAHHKRPIKFTAGLHHPFSNPENKAPHYGFINVFTAAILAFSKDLAPDDIQSCLTDSNPENFTFTPTHLTWEEHSISETKIFFFRQTRVRGFGSCSFDIPVADLSAMNLV